jgi:large conductance mechanosensitive channel
VLKGFRDFLMRGNVVDLAVAVVIGAAFGAVVTAVATDFIGGIIGAIGGSPDFNDAGFTVGGSKIVYGSTITALINFVIVASVIYFLVVVPMNAVTARLRRDADAATPVPSDEARLLTEIRDLLAERK